jgi:uncharacterized membrane protein
MDKYTNKHAYMAELRQRIISLDIPREDMDDALRFFNEYFDEAGPERETDVIAELGSPAYVAAQIALKLSPAVHKLGDTKKPRGTFSWVWIVILGIFAGPVALPLALAVAATMFGLAVAAFATVASFAVAGFVSMAGGVVTALYSITLLPADFATSIYFIGSGLFAFATGWFILRLMVYIFRLCMRGIARLGGFVLRKGQKITYANGGHRYENN